MCENALMKLESSLELSSLKQMAREEERVFLLLDTSGSMDREMANLKKRIAGLREVVSDIKAQGHVPMIAFGGPYDAMVRFVDEVPEPAGGTPLHAAIPFAKSYGATRLVVISDGEPDLRDESMIQAKAFGGRIDVVFVGDPGEPGSFFLDELAKASGGKRFEGDLGEAKKLAGTVIGLLEGEVEKKAPIQGEGFTTVEDVIDADEDDFEEDDDDEED